MHGGDIYSNTIKYDFSVNLNPFMPTENIRQAALKSLDGIDRYPEYLSSRLIKKLSEFLQCDDSYITVTNGASEAILSAVRSSLCERGVIFSPAFSGYKRALKAFGIDDIRFINCCEKELDVEKLSGLCEFMDNKSTIFFLASPSNPIGYITPIESIKKIYKLIKERGDILIVDECFINLSDERHSMIECINTEPEYYDNLVVIRSFTKTYSIPGIRLGYSVCSNKNFNNQLRMNTPEWNISVVAAETGLACIDENISDVYAKIKEERDYLRKELVNIGLKVYESQSVYIAFKSEINVYSELLKKGFLIRDCSDYEGLEKDVYRIAVKTHPENELIINAIKEVCKNG